MKVDGLELLYWSRNDDHWMIEYPLFHHALPMSSLDRFRRGLIFRWKP
jgi:hypothetical protein